MKRAIISAFLFFGLASVEAFAQSKVDNVSKPTDNVYVKFIGEGHVPIIIKIIGQNIENKHAVELSLDIIKELKKRNAQFIIQENIKSDDDTDVTIQAVTDLKKTGNDNWWLAIAAVKYEYVSKTKSVPYCVCDTVAVELKERALDDIFQWKDSIDGPVKVITEELVKIFTSAAFSKSVELIVPKK